MNYYDDENKIIHNFQLVAHKSVGFINENDSIVNVFLSIHDEDKWEKWNDNSSKSAPHLKFNLSVFVVGIDNDKSFYYYKQEQKNLIYI